MFRFVIRIQATLLLFLTGLPNGQSGSNTPVFGKRPIELQNSICTLPTQPENGTYFVISGTQEGNVVKGISSILYSCDVGYEMKIVRSLEPATSNKGFYGQINCIGNKWSHEIQCQAAGTISNSPKCVLPSLPSNGNYKIGGSFVNPGDSVDEYTIIEYTCDTNYVPSPSNEATCNNNGQWNQKVLCIGYYCTVPTNLENGKCSIDDEVVSPGKQVDIFSVMIYECNDRYFSIGGTVIICQEDGTWSESIQCLRLCKPLISLTHEITCTLNGKTADCTQPMRDGTTAQYKCQAFHQLLSNVKISKPLKCIEGDWDDNLKQCNPDCGKEASIANPLILGGTNVSIGMAPWHVGLYQKTNGVYNQICGGTIINRKIVISAAHCFGTAGVVNKNPEDYGIAAGKIKRSWNDEEPYAIKTMVEKIHIPDTYMGHSNYLAEDLAVIAVKNLFDFSNYVHPVCYDFTSVGFRDYQTSPGTNGKIVGWGLTIEGDLTSASGFLKKAGFSVISRKKCLDTMPNEFRNYVTTDKFCTDATAENATICNGDSGGGAVFNVIDYSNTNRWYLLGVVSVGALDSTRNTCLKNSNTVFTDLHRNNDFILQSMAPYA
ncbi:modular serine protease-like isoform X2 [Arctopsyche grandis]|uniref:modular serine protease-like isoform X2 n=1 Tax=Arctopsyche grandis TaxID=121162 RepID=UPI00406D88EC